MSQVIIPSPRLNWVSEATLHLSPEGLLARCSRQTHTHEPWVQHHFGVEPAIKTLGVMLELAAHAVDHGLAPRPAAGSAVRIHSVRLEQAVGCDAQLDVEADIGHQEGGLAVRWSSHLNSCRQATGVVEIGTPQTLAAEKVAAARQPPTDLAMRWLDLKLRHTSQSCVLDEVALSSCQVPTALARVRAPEHEPWLLVERGRPSPFDAPLWLLEAMGQAAIAPLAAEAQVCFDRETVVGHRAEEIWLAPEVAPGDEITLVVTYAKAIRGRWRATADIDAFVAGRLVGRCSRLVCLRVPGISAEG